MSRVKSSVENEIKKQIGNLGLYLIDKAEIEQKSAHFVGPLWDRCYMPSII